MPQVPPPACAGPLHTVDVADDGTRRLPGGRRRRHQRCPVGVTVPLDAGRQRAVRRHGRLALRGHGRSRPATPSWSTLNNGKSIVPMFNLFTDVPLPSRLRGLIIDDVNFSANPKNTAYGEKAPACRSCRSASTTSPTGWSRPSSPTTTASTTCCCPRPTTSAARPRRASAPACTASSATTPASPGRLNPNYNPRYRMIGTEFEAHPGRHDPDRPRPDPGRRADLPPGHGPAHRGHLPGATRAAAAVRGLPALRQRHRAASPSRAPASAPRRAPAR